MGEWENGGRGEGEKRRLYSVKKTPCHSVVNFFTSEALELIGKEIQAYIPL
jgi:hypothetical protein